MFISPRCGVPCLGMAGVVMAVFSMVGSMTVCGVWAWQLRDQLASNATNDSSHDELVTRAAVGVAEGLSGTILSTTLIVAFIMYNLLYLATWVTWCTAFAAFNAFSVYQCYHHILEQEGPPFPWEILLEVEWGLPFATACGALALEGVCLLLFLVVATKFVYKMEKGEFDVYSFNNYDDEIAFEMS